MVLVVVDSVAVLVEDFHLKPAAVVADCHLHVVAVVPDFVDPVSVLVDNFRLEIDAEMPVIADYD